MNYQRKTLLAGIAALALLAGAGAASAQETPKNQGAQTQQSHATQQMNQAPGGKMGQSAQQEKRGTNGRAVRNAAKVEHHGKPAAQRNEHNGKTAQRQNEHKGTAAQQRNPGGRENNAAVQRERNGMEGLQSNATGMNARLTDEQRTRIRDSVIHAAGAPRVGHVDFDVTVGTAVPRGRIHVIPVPEMLVRIEPTWRGFEYFVYEDEVVIVNPRDMRIVAVVPA
jgi:Protein of unknown function (DUF1236)